MSTGKRLTGRPWRRLQEQVYAEERTCGRCGRDVDQALPYNHDWARSVGHIIPPALGGTDERHNLRLEHRRCNAIGRHAGPFAPAPEYIDDDEVNGASQRSESMPRREPRSRIW